MTPDGVTLPSGVVEQSRRRGAVIPRPACPSGNGAASTHELFARLDWWVLNWNTPARDVYHALGGRAMDEWIPYRLDGGALRDLASEVPAAVPGAATPGHGPATGSPSTPLPS